MKAAFRKTVPILHKGTSKTIQTAVILLILVWVVEVLFFAQMAWFMIQHNLIVSPVQRLGATTLVVMIGGWLVLKVGLAVCLAFRQNWARYVELLLTVCGLMMTIDGLIKSGPDWKPFVTYGALDFANVAATLLLFVGPANAWFGRISTPSA
jgi:hypothetical protein